MLIDGQVAKEGCDVIFPRGFRMPFAVEQDEAAYPIDVDLLRPKAVMLDPEQSRKPWSEKGPDAQREAFQKRPVTTSQKLNKNGSEKIRAR